MTKGCRVLVRKLERRKQRGKNHHRNFIHRQVVTLRQTLNPRKRLTHNKLLLNIVETKWLGQVARNYIHQTS